eukprot:9503160-Pyramimonas_sp.AAC.1
MLGTKPGTALATDAFNYVFSPMARDLQARLTDEGLTWKPELEPGAVRFAQGADLDQAHDTISFVDDLIVLCAIDQAADTRAALVKANGHLAE